MTKYTKYNADTGEIECVFEATARDAALNQPCIEGEYKGTEYRIVDGAPVAKSQSEKDDFEIARAWVTFKNVRNGLLLESDWTQSNDSPLTDAKKAEWATYRQALRDLPANTTDPRSPTWPTPPT